MGDKSPKSKQKNDQQKETRNDAKAKKKRDIIADKKLANTPLSPAASKKKK